MKTMLEIGNKLWYSEKWTGKRKYVGKVVSVTKSTAILDNMATLHRHMPSGMTTHVKGEKTGIYYTCEDMQ